jgi:hypothetical protein
MRLRRDTIWKRKERLEKIRSKPMARLAMMTGPTATLKMAM